MAMVNREYRTKNRPKLRDTFQRLRAQGGEPKIISSIEDWLHETASTSAKAGSCRRPAPTYLPPPPSPPLSTIPSPNFPPVLPSQILGFPPKARNASPLRPTHGNQGFPPPRTSLKRKFSNRFATAEPRQSARIKKMPPPGSMGDGSGAKDEEDATAATGRRKPQGPTKKAVAVNTEAGNAPNTSKTPVEGEASASFKGSGSIGARHAKEADLQMRLLHETAIKHQLSMSTQTSPSKGSSSPSKASKVLNKRDRMEFLVPSITFRTLVDTKNDGELEGKLERLWLDYINWNEQAILPAELKEAMKKETDTPKKTSPSIPDSCFSSSYSRYAKDDLALIQLTVSDILSSANKYRHSVCTEAHWASKVISPLLNLVRRLKCYDKKDSKLEVVDLTAVELCPGTLCPISSESPFKDLDKRIDAAIGLDLSSAKRKILVKGVYSEGSLPSINQTASFVKFVPMFVNIEIKRPHTDRDPLIQLGAWITAEFTKRKTEGYSLDMPVLAIEIDGDIWSLHMVFAVEDLQSDSFQCNFVGPIGMGSTESLMGIYQILDRLCRCADWGVGEYQRWFDNEVLSKYGEV